MSDKINIHTRLMTTSVEVRRLNRVNDDLIKKIEELKILFGGLEELSKKNEYLKKKLSNI